MLKCRLTALQHIHLYNLSHRELKSTSKFLNHLMIEGILVTLVILKQDTPKFL
jgi:hypothetical protein